MLHGVKNNPAYADALDCAKRQPNLQVFAEDGAIISTIESFWQSEPKDNHPLSEFVVPINPSGATSGILNHRFLLGDFAQFARFLLQQSDRPSVLENISAPQANVSVN